MAWKAKTIAEKTMNKKNDRKTYTKSQEKTLSRHCKYHTGLNGA